MCLSQCNGGGSGEKVTQRSRGRHGHRGRRGHRGHWGHRDWWVADDALISLGVYFSQCAGRDEAGRREVEGDGRRGHFLGRPE